MRAATRLLGRSDQPAVEALLAERPVESLFLSAKLATSGIDRFRLGRLHGFEADGKLRAVCLDSGALFPAGADAAAIPAFVQAIGPVRRAVSIVGPAMFALGLFVGLSERWPGAWSEVSNIRQHQPLMLLEALPEIEPDNRVRKLTVADFQPYLAASVHMYTDEIGSSPYRHGPGYDSSVKQRLRNGDAYGIIEDGSVLFKADLGPRVAGHVQLQGVWVRPDLRGSGLSVPALAGMLRQVMPQYGWVSLYVNDFNIPAVRAYERLGFRQLGALATVHY